MSGDTTSGQTVFLNESKDDNRVPVGREDRIFAVVVTYNRKNLLLECLKGLSQQSRTLAGIILVDNASTDGTPDLLYQEKIINKMPLRTAQETEEIVSCPAVLNHLTVHYVRMSENSGGAGGFSEGVKRADQFHADWIWLMDDDIEPDTYCLEGLLSYSDLSKCLHPRKYFEDGVPHHWEGYLDVVTGRRVFQPDISFSKGFSFCTINTGCFEGMLIHREIVDQIGYPDKRFFIGSDDSVYGFLAHFYTPVLYLRDPFVLKKNTSLKTQEPISDRSIYYGMRNAFLFQDYLNTKVPRYRYVRSFFLVIRFFDYALNILQSRKEKRQGLGVLLKAVRDGISGRYGKGL